MQPIIPFVAAMAAALSTLQPEYPGAGEIPPAAVAPAISSGRATNPVPQPVVGTVQDSTGRPLSDAQVIIPALNRVTTTNEAGAFTFTGLPAGTYHIVTILIGYSTGHGDVTVTEAAAPPPITIV